jgi:hypothetical protein
MDKRILANHSSLAESAYRFLQPFASWAIGMDFHAK